MSLKLKGLKTIAIAVLVTFMTVSLRVDLLAAPKAKPQPAVEKKVTSAGQFQDLLKDTEVLLDGMGADLVKRKDVSTKLTQLRQRRSDLQELAGTIRGELDKTRTELIAKKLPPEIIQRHDAFAQNFENNLKDLLTNLDGADKAKKEQLKERVKAVRDHLNKNIYRERHIPLDPNKLPHRRSDFKPRKPITNPKEFKKLFPQISAIPSATRNQHAALSFGDHLTRLMGIGIAYAQGEVDPNLAETIEVQFTQEIKDLAAILNHDPVKIYEYVRNNFAYEPYYGSLKGAHETLSEKAGNDFDQASLLIALLRVSNIPARYVYGTIEVPIEQFMNWAGGFTDPTAAVTLIASGGIPVTSLISGGKIDAVKMEHVWVEAYVPYGNYRGARRDDSIKAWIPLDPNFKQYEYERGMDLYTALGINGEQYIMDYLTDTSSSPIPSDLQDLFPNYTISPYQYYSKRLLNYIDTNFPDATIEDIIGDETIELTKTIIKKEYPYLLGSLPYKVVVKGATYSAIPDSLRPRISFAIENTFSYETDLSYSITLPEITGKRITLSYIPASSTDETLVTQYGGNILNVPPYLLNVKPAIKIDGSTIATGNAVGLGYEQMFHISFQIPSKATDVVTNTVTAGDYSGIAIQYYKIPSGLVADKMEELTKNIGSTDLDDLLGLMLYNIGLSFLHHLTSEEELYAKNFQVIITKELAEAMATSQAVTVWLWGMPYKVSEGGIGIDVDRNVYVPFSLDGNQQRTKDFMIVSGIGSSFWEDLILESFFTVPSVSAARLLKSANQQGMPLYTIDKSNINLLLPQLQVSSEVIDDIQNAVNAGKKIIISKSNVQYNDWNGVGYIVFDPAKGSGAYKISGGLAGAVTSKPLTVSQRELEVLYRRLCEQKRWIILIAAWYLVGTPYVFGCKDPKSKCGGIDCSGLISYTYSKAGFKSVVGTNAQGQYNAARPTDYPFYVDLVFFIGTYDKTRNCIIDESDGITHVGMALKNQQIIAAQGKEVNIYPLKLTTYEKKATGVTCKEGITPPDISKGCPLVKGCKYAYTSTGKTFSYFAGYRYAPEFDSDVCKK